MYLKAWILCIPIPLFQLWSGVCTEVAETKQLRLITQVKRNSNPLCLRNWSICHAQA